jgi:hypothetical protein
LRATMIPMPFRREQSKLRTRHVRQVFEPGQGENIFRPYIDSWC